ncbi:hypothetical protein Tco_0784304 [Tanacetum coccineum]
MILLLRISLLSCKRIDPMLHLLYRYLHLNAWSKGWIRKLDYPHRPLLYVLGVDFEDESSEPSRSRGTDLEIDVDVERSDGIQIDPEVQVIESVQRDQGHRIVATGQQSANMLERIGELERDNRRLRDIVDVESQKVTRFRRSELHMQMELRQIRRFRFYDRMRIARLKAYARSHFSYHSYIVS